MSGIPVSTSWPLTAGNFDQGSARFGGDLVEDLHRFDEADGLAALDAVADLDEVGFAGRGRLVEHADHRAGERHEFGRGERRSRGRSRGRNGRGVGRGGDALDDGQGRGL